MATPEKNYRDAWSPESAALIEHLGGSVAVSKECGLTHSAVSQWKRNGIPKPWMLLFRERYPERFDTDGRVVAYGAEVGEAEVGKAIALAAG